MAVFHCPLCPLAFANRTEVEWHLRSEHRSRAEEDWTLDKELASAWRALEPALMETLWAKSSFPAVTLLLATERAEVMTAADAARMDALAGLARRRLAGELRDIEVRSLQHRLDHAVDALRRAATAEGLALFVSMEQIVAVRLPFGPAERVVVDPTFATRDLVFALQRFPRHRVLVLAAGGFRLYEGSGAALAEVAGSAARGVPHAPRRARLSALGRWLFPRPLLRSARSALAAAEQARGRLPYLVFGSARFVSAFRSGSGHGGKIGEASGVALSASTEELARVAASFLEGWLSEAEALALTSLEKASHSGRVIWGLGSCWEAIRSYEVKALWVEESASVAARVDTEGHLYGLGGDPEAAGMIDDVVDDLIEAALRKGADVHIVQRLNPPFPAAVGAEVYEKITGPALELREAVGEVVSR